MSVNAEEMPTGLAIYSPPAEPAADDVHDEQAVKGHAAHVAGGAAQFLKKNAAEIEAKFRNLLGALGENKAVPGNMSPCPGSEDDAAWVHGSAANTLENLCPWILLLRRHAFRFGPALLPFSGLSQYWHILEGSITFLVMKVEPWMAAAGVQKLTAIDWDSQPVCSSVPANCTLVHGSRGQIVFFPCGTLALPVIDVKEGEFARVFVYPVLSHAEMETAGDSSWQAVRDHLKEFWEEKKETKPWQSAYDKVVSYLGQRGCS